MAALTLLVVAGCDDTSPTPTPTIIVMPASPTVAPVMPTVVSQDTSNVGVSNFTPGAVPVSTGDLTITPTPAPTQAAIAMTFPLADGLVVAGTFYGAPSHPAPTALLLHMLGSNKESWSALAPQ